MRTLATEQYEMRFPPRIELDELEDDFEEDFGFYMDETVWWFEKGVGMMDNTIKLTDANGNDVHFEFLDLIEYEKEEFVVLLPVEDTAGEVVILKLESTDDPDIESYCSVEDEQLLEKVFCAFKEKFKNEFTFMKD